jgi:hypothetical protein
VPKHLMEWDSGNLPTSELPGAEPPGTVGRVPEEGPGIDIVGMRVGLGGDRILLYHANGSPVSEYATIALALVAASIGEVVVVPAGIFTENINIPAGVCILGTGNKSIIDGTVTMGEDSAVCDLNIDEIIGTDVGSCLVKNCMVNTIISGSGDTIMQGGSIGSMTTGVASYVPGAEIDTGEIDSTDEIGEEITGLTIDQWYAIECFNGFFTLCDGFWPVICSDFELSNNGGASWSGNVGWACSKVDDIVGHLSLISPSFAAYSEQVGIDHYGRTYFKATTTSVKIRVHDGPGQYDDNAGILSWRLRSATAPSGVIYVSAVRDGEDGIPILGDRSAWNAADYRQRHTNDIDLSTGIHHTLDDLDARYSRVTPPPAGSIIFSDANIGNPPNEDTLIAALGSPSTDKRDKAYIINDNGEGTHFYLAMADGSHWWLIPLAKSIPPTSQSVTVDDTIVLVTGDSPKDWHGRAAMKVLDGVTILVYRDGSKHEINDGELHIRFSNTYGGSWTAEDTYLDGTPVDNFPMNPPVSTGQDAGEPWLYIAPNGDLLLHMWRIDYGVSDGGTYQSRSTDGGKTWSDPEQIDFDGAADDDIVFSTDDDFVYGDVIYATARIYTSGPAQAPSQEWLIKSEDNGETWEMVSIIMDDDEGVEGTGSQEVGIEYLGNNTIIAMLRDNEATHSYKRISTDMGETWGSLIDVTSTVGIAGRQRVYTRSHLRGGDNWWQDEILIMVGFIHTSNGDSMPRRNAVWISIDAGDTWSAPFYIESEYDDGGYGDMIYDPLTNQYIVVSYRGTLETADLIQYNLILGGL